MAKREIIAIYRGHKNNFIEFKNQLTEILKKITSNKITLVSDIKY